MINFFKSQMNIDKQLWVVWLSILWQLISVGLMAMAVWPVDLVWLNLLLIAGLILWLSIEYALGLFILSLPFSLAMPNGLLTNIPLWRPLLVFLIIIVLVKFLWTTYSWQEFLQLFQKPFRENFKFIWQKYFCSWDGWFFLLVLLAVVTLIKTPFPLHGLKQVMFLLNIYLIYLVTVFVGANNSFEKIFYFIKYSVFITVGLGFLQYIASLFVEPYFFWQYWAMMVSSLYYGGPLAEVLSYSNSWFSSNDGGKALRMFGILQDTHAFGVVILFALMAWWVSTINFIKGSIVEVVRAQTWQFWVIVALLGFALLVNGTRGIWVAMLAPLLVCIWLVIVYKAKLLGLFPLLGFGLVVGLIIISPWVSGGLNSIRRINVEDNFFGRAISIYDPSETSNAGRLLIWQNSLKQVILEPLGVGYGGFISTLDTRSTTTDFDTLSQEKNELYNLPQKFVTAHSLYLQIMVELGVFGFILFVGLIFSILNKLWQVLKKSNFDWHKSNLFIMSFGVIFLWVLAYAVFDVTMLNDRVLLYSFLCLALLNIFFKQNKRL